MTRPGFVVATSQKEASEIAEARAFDSWCICRRYVPPRISGRQTDAERCG